MARPRLPLCGALLVACVARERCDTAEVAAYAKQFYSQGGLRQTWCPDDAWVEEFVRLARESPERCGTAARPTALVVGANKGYDCVGWAGLLSGRPELSKASWTEALAATLLREHGIAWANLTKRQVRGVCGQALVEYPRLPASAAAGPFAYCVEPLPSNSRVIVSAADASPWRGALRMIAAAATDAANGTLPFPRDAPFGAESIGFDDGNGSASARLNHLKDGSAGAVGAGDVAVRAVSVDALVREYLGGAAPAILTIDTEGSDALVLRGAAATLASGGVGFLEFEFHEVGPWRDEQLEAVVDRLDGLSYDCYWAGQRRLFPITGCWDARYAARGWSNIACAHRGHACWADAMRAHVANASEVLPPVHVGPKQRRRERRAGLERSSAGPHPDAPRRRARVVSSQAEAR